MNDALQSLAARALQFSASNETPSRRHSIASDDVSVLNRLIDHAMLAIALRRNPESEMVTINLEMVCAAVARPSDGNRAICHHTAMFASAVERCDAAINGGDMKEAQIYSRVIGALFPDVRDDAGRALANRMRPTP
jgi:hypothetical protein